MNTKEVFGMLEKLPQQSTEEREATFRGFTEEIIAKELERYGVTVGMTEEAVTVQWKPNVSMFAKLQQFWESPPADAEYSMSYDNPDGTEEDRKCDLLAYSADIKKRLDFMHWLNDNAQNVCDLGLVLDNVNFDSVFFNEESDTYSAMAVFTDMYALDQGPITIWDSEGMDHFYDEVSARRDLRELTLNRKIWRDNGIDISFTMHDGTINTIRADYYDENGDHDGFDVWSSAKEALDELKKRCGDCCSDSDCPLNSFMSALANITGVIGCGMA